MSFINGLKIFFKKPLYVLILISFIISWFLILLGTDFTAIGEYYLFLFIFIAIIAGFNFLLLVISLFKSVEDLHSLVIILVFLVSLPTVFIFRGFLILFSFICLIVNQLLTAFFAFKLCMDSSTKFDNILYKSEKVRKFTRLLEFIFFGLVTGIIFIFTWNLLSNQFPLLARSSANIFRIIFWVNMSLMIIVLTRLVVMKKFAAYITLFFVLTFFYILYIIIDLIAGVIFPDTRGFVWYSFLIDLFLFIYIIGSIFDKIEYLEKKLKYIKAETLSLFIILMKLIAQFTKIFPNFPGLDTTLVERQQVFILIIFIFFTLLFGIHSIIAHKEGKRMEEIIEST